MGENWAIFPLTSLVAIQDDPVDIYILANCSDTRILGTLTFLGELPNAKEVKAVFKRARKMTGRWPEALLIPKEDPCEGVFCSAATSSKFTTKVVPTSELEHLRGPIQEGFEDFQRW